jgi:hypothetical protein
MAKPNAHLAARLASERATALPQLDAGDIRIFTGVRTNTFGNGF